MITLHKADGTTRELEHAQTNEVTERLDRTQYRPPFGTGWKSTGSGHPEPQRVSITVEVGMSTNLEAIRPTLDAIIADAADAVGIETPLGDWPLEGLITALDQPIQAGYRLDLIFLAGAARVPAGAYGHGAYGAGAYGGNT